MAKQTRVQAPRGGLPSPMVNGPQTPPPPTSPQDAGNQAGMDTTTAPFPPAGPEQPGMNNASPGPTMNMPVNSAVQTHKPIK